MPFNSEVIRRGLGFGEAPRWHSDRFWYSDFYRHGVFSCAADGSDERREHTVDTQPSGLGWLPNGDLLIVSMTDHRILRVRDGETSELLDISPYCGFWANDMVTSDAGISYVGNFGFDLDAAITGGRFAAALAEYEGATLAMVDQHGRVHAAARGLRFPNGMVVTPDGGTMIVAETLGRRLTAFDIGIDGSLTNQRLWAEFASAAPDGICLDQQGAVWIADALHLVQDAAVFTFTEVSAWPDQGAGQDPSRGLAPVAGTVAQVLVKAGDKVSIIPFEGSTGA